MKSELDIVRALNEKLPDSAHAQGLCWGLSYNGYVCSIDFGGRCIWDCELSLVEHIEESDYHQDVYDYCVRELTRYQDMLGQVVSKAKR